ncbi:DUF58 domain-containing protein [Natronorubrum halophilum]|uniref:DUF58 domain-containing protein n=1 Tax=Natronorubrum halophilum TaxID=1702106 RepID=UPI000EF689C9|nr:DUF58 domain-containing protein [Natronorubrum halophilum]
MGLTIRGWSAVLVVIASVAMAWEYGPRALNAIVTPLLVVLAAGLITTYRADRPEIRRVPVGEGFVGARRTVETEIETGTTVSATVRDTVGDGVSVTELDSDGAADTGSDGSGETAPALRTTLAGDTRFRYEIRLEERGEHRIGPLTITISDVFGLVNRRFTYEEPASVLVYPRVHDLWDAPGQDLRAFVEAISGRDRKEFDHLREYQRGDALRDVNWKSAAKRTDADLVVTEYTADEEAGSATVAAECAPGWDDELATALASITTYLLEGGVSVGVVTPDDDHAPGSGQEHHYELLAQFAVLGHGELEDRQRRDADVLVQADADGTRVVIDGRAVPFGRLTKTHSADTDRAADRGVTGQRRERTRTGPGQDESGVAT